MDQPLRASEAEGDRELLRTGFGRVAVAALALLAAGATSGPSLAAGRVALVIGTAAYQHTAALRNPQNDAVGIARNLRELGFTVIEGLDLDEDAFETKLREFARAASGADATLFYYAGHGLQVEGENYLVPVDAELASEVDLRLNAISLRTVVAEMWSEANLVFLDACRDNPLARNLASSMGSSCSSAVGRGLGRVEAAPGALIAYATQPGNVAEDGEGENSPFTEALLVNLSAPGDGVNDLMTSVTNAVATRTGGRQQPWTHSSLRKSFYFVPAEVETAGQAPDRMPAEVAGADAGVSSGGLAAEETAARAYEAAERLHTVEGYEAVAGRFPGSVFAKLALAQVRKLREGLPAETESGVSTVAAIAPGDSLVVAPPAAVAVPEEVSAEPDPSPSPPGPEAVERSFELDRSERRLVQLGLSSLGFDPGPADGLIGRGTRVAIGRLQLSRGLSVTGFLDAELAKELLSAAAEAIAADDAAFARAQSSGSSNAYGSYLGAYPAGRHASEARDLLAAAEASERLGPGTEFRDCPACPAMVVVPAGSFRMGSPSGEAGRDGDEGPVHGVEISRPFAVGKYEVTFAEWDACVSGGGCGHRPDDAGWGRGTRPAINVGWEDARSYVSWLSVETGARYRLLSESEWEYAARAGTVSARYWGEDPSSACRYANVADRTLKDRYSGWMGIHDCRDGHVHTSPAGTFDPNGFGLHDMLGNVREWVEDCVHGSYAGAPADGSAWTSGDCSARVLRGGSWSNRSWNLRSAYRYWDSPDGLSGSTGFRVARTLD